MSTPGIPRYPAAVPDPSDYPGRPAQLEQDRVSFGGAQTIEADTARAVMRLWYNRAPANVGTALAADDVGPLVLELLTSEVLSLVLTAWRDRNPALFGSYLAEALTGARPSATRKRERQ